MLDQMNLFNLDKFTCSPVSGSGATHSDKPDGKTIDPSSPAVVRANPSQQPEKKKEQTTSATCGPKCFDSSLVYRRAKDRQQYLVNRLRSKLDRLGSTMYKQTWREKTTPQGWSFSQLVASAHRTSGKDSTGLPTAWNTPGAMDGNRGPDTIMFDENGIAHSQRISQTTGTKFGMSLVTQSQLTGWPTATSSDKKQSRRTTTDKQKWINPNDPQQTQHTMLDAATLTGWPTATARDHKDTGKNLSNSNTRKDGKSRLDTVPRVATLTGPARLTATGEMRIGSGAETINGGQLNPALSRWLMGLPPEWCDSAATAMLSSRRKHKRSSKPT